MQAQRTTWTLEQANALLPTVREALRRARAAVESLREAELQMQDLRIVWGDQVLAVACPDHAEWLKWRDEHTRRRGEVEAAMLRFDAIGCEAKDLEVGLVDFRGRLGDEEVYLCWRDGEAAITHYHALDAGFAGRKPIPRLAGATR